MTEGLETTPLEDGSGDVSAIVRWRDTNGHEHVYYFARCRITPEPRSPGEPYAYTLTHLPDQPPQDIFIKEN